MREILSETVRHFFDNYVVPEGVGQHQENCQFYFKRNGMIAPYPFVATFMSFSLDELLQKCL